MLLDNSVLRALGLSLMTAQTVLGAVLTPGRSARSLDAAAHEPNSDPFHLKAVTPDKTKSWYLYLQPATQIPGQSQPADPSVEPSDTTVAAAAPTNIFSGLGVTTNVSEAGNFTLTPPGHVQSRLGDVDLEMVLDASDPRAGFRIFFESNTAGTSEWRIAVPGKELMSAFVPFDQLHEFTVCPLPRPDAAAADPLFKSSVFWAKPPQEWFQSGLECVVVSFFVEFL